MSFPADVPPADDQIHRALSTPQRPTKSVEDCTDKQAEVLAPPPATTSSPAAASGSSSTRPAAAASTTAPRKKKAGQKQTSSSQEQKPLPRQESGVVPGVDRVTREYKRRMPKQRATAWPSSILSDPDVLSLDDEGRFVLCKVCHVHYAVHGGKKPKPVIMNSIFRTRAWEVHKERTNSHRMQKRSAEIAAKADTTPVLPAHAHGSHQQQLQHEHQQQLSRLHQQHQRAQHQRHHRPEATARRDVSGVTMRRQGLQDLPSSHDSSPLRHAPPRGTQEPDPPPRAPQPPPPLPSLQRCQSDGASSSVLALSRTPMLTNNIMSEQDLRRRVSGNERLFIRPGGLSAMLADSTQPTPVHSDAQGESQERSQEDWTSGSKGSSRDSQPNDQAQSGCVSNEQAPAQPAERTAQPAAREAADVEHTEAPASVNQIERRLRKRKSWERDEGTDSSKEEETRESPGHKARDQYWRTLREVYTTSRTKRGASDAAVKEKKKKKKKRSMESKTTNREGMTEIPLRTVVVHDPTLINAIDRLAGVLSKQLSEMRTNESSTTRHFMSTLTTEVSEMRRCQEDAMERMLNLGERHLKVMEGILQCKLRKEQRISDGATARRRDAPPPSSSSSSDEQQQQQQP